MFLKRGDTLEPITTQEPSFTPLPLTHLNTTARMAIEVFPHSYERSPLLTENARRKDELNLKAHLLLSNIFSSIASDAHHCPLEQPNCNSITDKNSFEAQKAEGGNTKTPTPEQETASNAIAKKFIANFFKSPSKLEKMLSHYMSANEKKKDPDFDQGELENLPDGIREQLSHPEESGASSLHMNDYHRKISRKTVAKREHSLAEKEAEDAKSHFDAEDERSKAENELKQSSLQKQSVEKEEKESEKESEQMILKEGNKINHNSESQKTVDSEQTVADTESNSSSPPGTELEDEGKILRITKSPSKQENEDESSEGEQLINIKSSQHLPFHRSVANLPIRNIKKKRFSKQQYLQKSSTNTENMHVSDSMIQNELSNYLERTFHQISPTQVKEMSKVLANILLISLNKIFPNPLSHDVPTKMEYSGIAPNAVVKPGEENEPEPLQDQMSMFSTPKPQPFMTQKIDEWTEFHRRQPDVYSKPVDPDAIALLQSAPKLYTPRQLHIPVNEAAMHTMDDSVAAAMPGSPSMFQLENTASHVPGTINTLEDQSLYQFNQRDSTTTNIPLQDDRRIHEVSANSVTQRTQDPQFQEVFPGEINFGINQFHSPPPPDDDQQQVQQPQTIGFEQQPPQTRTVKTKLDDTRLQTVHSAVRNRPSQLQPMVAMQRSPVSIDPMSYVGLDNSAVLNGDRKDNIFNADNSPNKNNVIEEEKGLNRQKIPLTKNPDQLLDMARSANRGKINKAFPTDSSVGFDTSSNEMQDSGVDIKSPIMADDSAAMPFDAPQQPTNNVENSMDSELGGTDENLKTPDIHDPDLLLEYVNHKSLLEKTVTNYPGDISDKLIENTKIKEIEDTGFQNHADLLGREHIDPAISLHLKQPLVVAGKILEMNQPEGITEENIKSAVEAYAPSPEKNLQSQFANQKNIPYTPSSEKNLQSQFANQKSVPYTPSPEKNLQPQFANQKNIPLQMNRKQSIQTQFSMKPQERSQTFHKINPNLEKQGKAYSKELYLDKNDLQAAEKARIKYLSSYDKALKPIEFSEDEEKAPINTQQQRSSYDGNAPSIDIQQIHDRMSRLHSDLKPNSMPLENDSENENISPEKKMSMTGFENDDSVESPKHDQPKSTHNDILENLKAIKSYIKEQKKALLKSADEKEINSDTNSVSVKSSRKDKVESDTNTFSQAESSVDADARYARKHKPKHIIKEKEDSEEVNSDYDLLNLNGEHEKRKSVKKSAAKPKHLKKKKHSQVSPFSSSPDSELFFWDRMYGDMNL